VTPLLHDQLAPITTEFGFLECGLQVAERWVGQREEAAYLPRGGTIRKRTVHGSLEALLRSLLPLTTVERRRHLLIATATNWTACFDNGWQGTDAAGLSYAAEQLNCRGVRIVAEPKDRNTGRYGAVTWELYGPRPTAFLNFERSLSVTNDAGKWVFVNEGTPLPFERAEAYKARVIRERFTPDLLDEYLQALGIRAFDADFYCTQGTLIERVGPTLPTMKEYSLEEAQLGLPKRGNGPNRD